jgi:hypothetical protein
VTSQMPVSGPKSERVVEDDARAARMQEVLFLAILCTERALFEFEANPLAGVCGGLGSGQRARIRRDPRDACLRGVGLKWRAGSLRRICEVIDSVGRNKLDFLRRCNE